MGNLWVCWRWMMGVLISKRVGFGGLWVPGSSGGNRGRRRRMKMMVDGGLVFGRWKQSLVEYPWKNSPREEDANGIAGGINGDNVSQPPEISWWSLQMKGVRVTK